MKAYLIKLPNLRGYGRVSIRDREAGLPFIPTYGMADAPPCLLVDEQVQCDPRAGHVSPHMLGLKSIDSQNYLNIVAGLPLQQHSNIMRNPVA
jgi:hypothetical protein